MSYAYNRHREQHWPLRPSDCEHCARELHPAGKALPYVPTPPRRARSRRRPYALGLLVLVLAAVGLTTTAPLWLTGLCGAALCAVTL